MAMRSWLTGTACLALLGAASPAWASEQDSAVAAKTFNEQSGDRPAPAATAQVPAEQDSGAIGDIVVTATRRDEKLQDVPISITAIGGAELARTGITNTLELTQTVPALNMRFVNFAVQPIIRGVGTRGTTNGDEANVAVYVDGIYQAVPAAAAFDLLNIQRVEVLRGPQGTLFGRNATGGLINVVTNDPSQELHFKGALRYGRFNERSADAYLTAGLAENLAFDIAGRVYEDDGYIKDVLRDRTVGDRHTTSLRSRLLFTPTDQLSVKLTGSYSKFSDSSSVFVNPYKGNTSGRSLANNPRTIVTTKPYTTAPTDPDQLLRARSKQVALDVKYDLGPVSLQNSASFQDTSGDFRGDNDGTLVDLGQNEAFDQGGKTYQDELRLLSNGDSRFSYILGAYVLSGSTVSGPIFSITPAARIIIDSTTHTRSYAGFGEGTYNFGGGFKVTGGLRYTDEHRELDGTTTRNGVLLSAASGLKANFSKLTYRAIVQKDVGKLGNIYASYSRGFKSGVFNASSTSPTSKATKPEVLDAYEIGVKTDPTPWLRLNASVFHYDYKDIQLSSRDPGSGLVVLFNAGSANIKGGELEATLRPTRELNVRAYANYLDAKYTNFPGAQIFETIYQDQSGIGLSAVTPIGNRTLIADVSGSRLIRAPKYTFGGSFDYTKQTNSGDFGITGNLFRSGKFFWDVNNRTFQPAYTVLNGEISWTLPGDKYRFSIWGKNLTNAVIQKQLNPSATLDGVSYDKPITYGVALTVTL